ncbi:PREDICTED: transmembrane protein 64-like [Lupinus angustifolius]|nr:PREDICTED: transmembrane protein 64-like [Lupinus angustifolius]
MTYYDGGRRGDEVDPDQIHTHHDNGDYVKLMWDPLVSQPESTVVEFSPAARRASFWYWVKVVASLICLILLAFVGFKWVGPFFIEKVIIPLMNWVRNTFTIPELAILVVASVALFPTILLPSSPSMWLAGMTFGYGFGFLLITSAVAVGVSLPFFIGSVFLHHKIEGWLEKYPKRASILRAAGGGNWFHQFKAVVLIRISPFPYILYNYCSVATNVKYGPYLLGSLVGMLPDIVLSIYTGSFLQTVADASHKKHNLSAMEIIVNIVGFCITVGTIIFITIYAKRRLKELEKEDELLLQ